MEDNLKLWGLVCETDPKFTKKANVRGNKITAIDPQYQVMKATEQFGSYGLSWGFKEIEFDYSLLDIGMIVFNAVFFFPSGEFPIVNSSSLYTDNAKTKIDQDFAKKIETDTLTKALSKLGFNADIFLGKHDSSAYIDSLNKKLNPVEKKLVPFPVNKFDDVVAWAISKKKTIEYMTDYYDMDEATSVKLKNKLNEKA